MHRVEFAIIGRSESRHHEPEFRLDVLECIAWGSGRKHGEAELSGHEDNSLALIDVFSGAPFDVESEAVPAGNCGGKFPHNSGIGMTLQKKRAAGHNRRGDVGGSDVGHENDHPGLVEESLQTERVL